MSQNHAKSDPLVVRALECFKESNDAEAPLRRKMLADYKFAAGEQWDADVLAQRAADGRPALVIDRLSGPIKQVINQIRNARPAIQVNPVDSGTDVKTAQDLQGLIRRVENQSDAEVAYTWAAEHQVKMGRGFWRVVTDYVESDGGLDAAAFEQDIYIRRIKNQFSVYFDPGSVAVDGSDAQWCLIAEDLTPDHYKARFGESKVAEAISRDSLNELMGTGDGQPDWLTEKTIRIAEYFYIEHKPKTLWLLPDGSVIAKPEGAKKEDAARLDVRAERVLHAPIVKWALLNAVEVLDKRDWPGRYIPVVPVYGEETVIEGKTDYRGIVRMGTDPQRMINYERSAQVQTVAQAPQSPFLVDAKSISQYKSMWDTANTRAYTYLPYDSVNASGQAIAPPQRIFGEPPIQAMVMLGQQFENDLRAATGFFDVQGEEKKPEQSGKAILARQRQGEVGSSHYLSNLGRGIKQTAKIILDLMPAIYDTPRIMRILDSQDQPKAVAVGPQEQTQQLPEVAAGTVKSLFDPSVGRYDITISVGKEYESARQENVEVISTALQGAPQLWPIIGHLLFEQMDSPIAKRAAEALAPKKDGIPPELAAQMQQMEQIIQQLQAEKQSDMVKEQAETERLAMKLQAEKYKADEANAVKLTEIESKLNAMVAQAMLDWQTQQLGFSHDINMTAAGQGHEQQMAAQGHERQMEAGQVQHAQSLEAQQQAAQQKGAAK